MAAKIMVLLLLSLSLSMSPCFSEQPASTPMPPDTACSTAPDPLFCRSVLPPGGSDNLYGYGVFSVRKSLHNAELFSKMVNSYLSQRSGTVMSTTAARALGDCQQLMDTNIGFLQTTLSTLSASSSTAALSDPSADELHTVLSAVLTNQETCLDGLQTAIPDFKARDGISSPLSNGTRLYSVTLALFTKAWVVPKNRQWPPPGSMPSRVPKVGDFFPPPGRKARKKDVVVVSFRDVEIGSDGALPLKMSEASRKLFEARSRRRILQSSGGGAIYVSTMVVVRQDGYGDFTTISSAVTAAPNNTLASQGYFLIFVAAGVYNEYVAVPAYKKYVMIVGDGIGQTVITGSRSAGSGWPTFSSATLTVEGVGFVLIDVSVRNTAGPANGQAVAMRSSADLTAFYASSFEAYQDTLYVHSMRQFYRECDIYGTVDFIFGNAAAALQNCSIYPRLPLQGQGNMVTAQGRADPNQNTGISLQFCTVKNSSELAAATFTVKTYLGRPWKLYSRTVVMQSFLDGLVDPAGWSAWSGTYALDTLYYAEYANTGPGSGTASRVTWPGFHLINAGVAVNFTVSRSIAGDSWLPQTGVPYWGGL